MNKIISILSHCNNQEKIDILIENINLLRDKTNFKILLNSHISLPQNIVDMVDYFIFDKSNPIMDVQKRSMIIWKRVNIDDYVVQLNTINPDYGWTPFNKIKNSLSFISNLDFDNVTFLNYDLKITDKIIDEILSVKENIFYDVESNGDIFKPGLLIFNVQKKDFNTFLNELTVENYTKYDIAETFLRNIISKISYEISKIITTDKIRINGNDTFNCNVYDNKFKCFIENGEINNAVFYDVIEDTKLNVNERDIIIEKGKNYLIKNIKTIVYIDEKLENIDKLIKEIEIL
jgi:hypothetical protein